MITSLLLAVRVCELVLVVQKQYEQVPIFPQHPWVARVANVYIASRIVLISSCCTSPNLAVCRVVAFHVPGSNGQHRVERS